MYTWVENISQNTSPYPKSTFGNNGENENDVGLWQIMVVLNYLWKNSNNKIPGRTGPETKAHVAFSRQRVIAQFFKVLGPQILVGVPRHRIFTCRRTKARPRSEAAQLRMVCGGEPAPLVFSKHPSVTVIFSWPLHTVCTCHVAGKSTGRG